MWVGKPQGMNLCFVSPEGIWIEEGPWAGRTGQPYTQVGPAHMGANGHTRGGQSFTAPLNPALIDPLDAPHIQMDGCHVSRDGNLQGLRDGQGGAFCVCVPPSAMGAEDCRSTPSCSWEGGFDMVVVGIHQRLLTGDWAMDVAQWDRAPHTSLPPQQ